jgi:hypothetical protein
MATATLDPIKTFKSIAIAISNDGTIPLIIRIAIEGIDIPPQIIEPIQIGTFIISKPGSIKYRVWAYDDEQDSWKHQRSGELEVGHGSNLFRWNNTQIVPA